MPNQAHVTSVDALEMFRANLIVYAAKARTTIEEVSAEVMRTRLWLQHEQRTYWEGQIRRRKKELEQAQQELFSANIANLREVTTAEQLAVRAAKKALDEAEAKLRVLKHWEREFDSRAEPLVKQLERLHTLLSNNLPQGIAHLGEMVKSLAAYAEMRPALDSTAPPTEQPAIIEHSSSGEGGNV